MRNPRPLLAPLAALVALAAAPPLASADTVVVGNQIVQGFQCLGPECANGEAMSGLKLWEKSSDTPGVRLAQTGTGGYTPQTWDVAGNEANFFIRDLTGGSRLPFRIRPGAPTSSIDIGATGDVSTAGEVQQSLVGLSAPSAVDGDAVLAALGTVPISSYTVGGVPRVLPDGAAFRAAFGVGSSDTTLASQDVASIALAAVQALDARVTALERVPGPKGDTGATGATGAKGDAGAAASSHDLTAANARIAALERSNAKLAKSLASIKKQVTKLAASTKRAHKPKARSARATTASAQARGAGDANGR